jgi:LPS-assembly lipoprotein
MSLHHPPSTDTLRLLFCSALLALLAGCGFHPRGELQLPPNMGPVKVQASDPYSTLADSLARALERSGAQSANGDAHTATLRIAGETFREGPLSVDNLSRVREYMLIYVVNFEFTAADGSVLVPLQEVKLQRDYTYDVTHALGSAAEQGTIRDEMQRDMSASILRRIGIALRNKTP